MTKDFTSAEAAEREELGRMGKFGLLDPDLTEEQIYALEKAYQAEKGPPAEEATSNPEELAEEYRTLSRKLFDEGLEEAELRRYRQLSQLAKEHKFEKP